MKDSRPLIALGAALAFILVGSVIVLRATASPSAGAPSPPSGVSRNLVRNPGFEIPNAEDLAPAEYALSGSARWRYVGNADEIITPGISLESHAASGMASGSVSQLVRGIDPKHGRWLRFSFRGLPEEGFHVAKDQLLMRIEFFSKNGANPLDAAQRLIYREVERDRKNLSVNGDFARGGAAVWRTYELEELLPFPEVDAVRISVVLQDGDAPAAEHSAFFMDDLSLTQAARSSRGLQDPAEAKKPQPTHAPPSTAGMIPLGGRWFYQPAPGEAVPTDASGHLSGNLAVTEANADRLFYRDDRLVNPFAGNMTAWMRQGYLDRAGRLLTEDRLVPDNVTLLFDGSDTVTVRTKNIPNHPTAKFPDTYGTQGYNPGYIQEQDQTWRLPLEPRPNPEAVAMTANDANGALPMGPVGIAVNGVVFFNPFDATMQDASSLMDRCCGHPNPGANQYHYHKYPVCVNTPFVDKGEGHSPLIGFAFDGLPIYGPYEAEGLMAKDAAAHPLNAFNLHKDDARGWHYHVTPGKFPYIIGGYYGVVDRRNFRRPGGPGRPGGTPGR